MFCSMGVGPGTLVNVRAVGLRERPGSGLPNPVRRAVTGVDEGGMVRVPVNGPVVVGVKRMLRKQEALGMRSPVQGRPPVGRIAGSAKVKLPVAVGGETLTVVVVRLVRVKRGGALLLWTGMGPKSCGLGVRMSPVNDWPVPVSVRDEGVPEVVEVRVRVAVLVPTLDGWNCTPSQQLVQGPV